MQEHPELPIVPMVDSEIVADDGGYWIGSWGKAYVDEYLWAEKSERYLFKSDNDVFDVLERYLPDEAVEKLPDTEEESRPFFDALPWKKAIIVYITLPD